MLNDNSTLALIRFHEKQQIDFQLECHQPVDHIGLFYAALDVLLGKLVELPNDKETAQAITNL